MSVRIGRNVVVGDISGSSVTVNGMKIQSGRGGIVITGLGEDTPEIHETYDGIRSVTIESDGGDVSIQSGDKFSANGHGQCRKSGSNAVVSSFDGELTLPVIDRFDVVINSGSVHGDVGASSLDVKVNSGSLSLSVRNKDHAPTINAKVNSGNVNITVM